MRIRTGKMPYTKDVPYVLCADELDLLPYVCVTATSGKIVHSVLREDLVA